MPDNYMIDPSNQQGQPQDRKGSIGSPNKAAGSAEIVPGDRIKQGPQEIPNEDGAILKPGEGPIPIPDHPGLFVVGGRVDTVDTSPLPMGAKIGKKPN